MVAPTLEEIVVADRDMMYRLDNISDVAHNVNTHSVRGIISVHRQLAMPLRPRVLPYVKPARLLPMARLSDYWLRVDEPLISAFIERSGSEWVPLGLRDAYAGWFKDMFGQMPSNPERNACTVTCGWLKHTFGVLPDDASKDLVAKHARAYIMMLLSTALLGIRLQPGFTSGGSPSSIASTTSGNTVGDLQF
ncbi:hypothetical protein PIB30_016403 [Stylosanthes scabra]|uniref:Uncharacterized protein n=1 Tax=Stylosanthes scabra TaxID=79078 RepID=A0ABU6U6B7_9FABA|nr:hypothetical protein [Stylosanthes scabra]